MILQVFIIGGVGDKHYYNDVWILDVNACCWARLDICGQQPQGRFSHTAVSTESDIAIYGGCVPFCVHYSFTSLKLRLTSNFITFA